MTRHYGKNKGGPAPEVYTVEEPAAFAWNGDKQAAIDHICRELSKGGWPLSVIRSRMVPPIPKRTLGGWRANNEEWAEAIDDAFETGSDNLAARMRMMSLGATGHTTGSVERDKLACWTADKLLSKWDKRYRERQVHENDPDNPAPPPMFVLQPVKSLHEIEKVPGIQPAPQADEADREDA